METVGPTVGSELRRAAKLSVEVSLAGIMLYIWLRFEWQFALAAVLAFVHDVVVTVGFFAMFPIEFALSSVAALLTIAGYSINDVSGKIRSHPRDDAQVQEGDWLGIV